MKKLTAVFFDMGSTLSYQDPTREEVLADFLRESGYERTVHEVRRAILSADTWWHEWVAQEPFAWRQPEQRETLRLRYRQAFLDALGVDGHNGLRHSLEDIFRTSIMRRHNAIYADVLPTLQALRAAGLRLAIVSNWDNTLMDHCRELGIVPYFDTIVGSLDVGYEKPNRRIFDIALERVGVRPEQTLHVGDMYPADVAGARRAGITPVLLDRYDLQPDADCLRVRTLDEVRVLAIPGAT